MPTLAVLGELTFLGEVIDMSSRVRMVYLPILYFPISEAFRVRYFSDVSLYLTARIPTYRRRRALSLPECVPTARSVTQSS